MDNQELGIWLGQRIKELVQYGHSAGGSGAQKIVEADGRQFHLAATWTRVDPSVALVTIKTNTLRSTTVDSLIEELRDETTSVPHVTSHLEEDALITTIVIEAAA